MSIDVHGDVHARGARLDFAVNVVAGGTPPWLRSVIEQALLDRYPDERAAIAAVAERHARDPEEVVLLNGAAQGFTLIARALTPRHAVCVHPSFTEPERALRAAGHPVARAITRPPHASLPEIAEEADLVVLGNPTNPTGTLHTRDAIQALTARGRTVVVDEAFIDFSTDGEAHTLARDPHTVVLRSLTKAWSIPGVRAGYLLAPKPLATRLRAAREPWAVNAPALAAIEAIARRGPDPHLARRTATARADLTARLRAAGLTTLPSTANYVLAEHPQALELTATLERQGIAVRPAGTFPGLTDAHIRLAVRTPAEHAELGRALSSLPAATR